MRPKNRKWVALAAVFYLLLIYAAYRWAISQRPVDGNIFAHIEREEVRKLHEQQAHDEKSAPQPKRESRLAAAGPAYVVARYDQNRVVFIVATDAESRFATSISSAPLPPRKFLRRPILHLRSPDCKNSTNPTPARCGSFPRSFRPPTPATSGP